MDLQYFQKKIHWSEQKKKNEHISFSESCLEIMFLYQLHIHQTTTKTATKKERSQRKNKKKTN